MGKNLHSHIPKYSEKPPQVSGGCYNNKAETNFMLNTHGFWMGTYECDGQLSI